MIVPLTRRQLLATGSAWIAARILGGRGPDVVCANVIPNGALRTAHGRRLPPTAWLQEPLSSDQYRALALRAMDAARDAGAEVADIRIGSQRVFGLLAGSVPYASILHGYGIRARVGGMWGFQHGTVMTPDAVVTSARSATNGAMTYAAINTLLSKQASTIAGAPVVTGEWRVPVMVDPFEVPIDDHIRVVRTLEATTRDLKFCHAQCGFAWTADTRVFASTEGSCVTQYLMRASRDIIVSATLPKAGAGEGSATRVPSFTDTSAGFEAVLLEGLSDRVLQTVETAIQLCELPLRAFDDVGRYPVILDGSSMGTFIGQTLNQALDGDRVAGFERDAAGTTFLTPPEQILGATTPQWSPVLTVHSDRALPAVTAVQWDDDGVAPESYTLIDRGRVVDYHTTRSTAPTLASWNQQHDRPVHSHGCSVATTPYSLPVSAGGALTVVPTATRASIDDLMRGMAHGFVILDGSTVVEPGLTRGLIRGSTCLEVRRGVPIARVGNVQFHANVQSVLRNDLLAVGDASTVRDSTVSMEKGIPWQALQQPVTAPAAYFKALDVWRY